MSGINNTKESRREKQSEPKENKRTERNNTKENRSAKRSEPKENKRTERNKTFVSGNREEAGERARKREEKREAGGGKWQITKTTYATYAGRFKLDKVDLS